MASPHIIPVGTSEPQDFALANDGAVLDLTGVTPTLEIEDGSGDAVSPAPSVAVLVAASGTVRVTDTEDLGIGTYRVRFKLTDSGGEIGFAPNGSSPMIWRVVDVP